MQEDSQKTPSKIHSKDFLRTIVEEDLKTNRYGGKVITRFPPEPNGFPHIGHAKSICLNFGIAKDYNGICHLRMDDTNPTTEDLMYVEAIKDNIKWLGFDWNDKLFFASDYFPQLYEYAIKLIEMGKAYVCSLSEQQIREYRGTVTKPGIPSPYRTRSIEKNLELFCQMKEGKFQNGEHVLRAIIDMSSPNMKMRDPLLYRIKHAHHYRTGDQWCIYPMYDFAHCLSDYIEGITHSICTLEFENNRELYDWILDELELELPRPYQFEFARLNLNYTVMSKRRLLELVEKNFVRGWDDPRLPTLAGIRRRGYTPESIRNFCESIGIAKANSTVDFAQLEFCIRDDLNAKVPRVLCVMNPLKVVIENYPENTLESPTEMLKAPYYPHDVPLEGSREIPFAKTLYIEREDFEENPPKGFFRLSPGNEVRLRHAYIIKCEKVIKDQTTGEITELRCSYDPYTKSTQNTKSGEANLDRKVKGTIHWVAADFAKNVEVRLYDRLYLVENPDAPKDINPESLKILSNCYIEPNAVSESNSKRFQFERQGYFYIDPVDSTPEKTVFNRIVKLKDSWSRQSNSQVNSEVKSENEPLQKRKSPEIPKKTKELGEIKENTLIPLKIENKIAVYKNEMGLGEEIASIIAKDISLLDCFEKLLEFYNNPLSVAKWTANEISKIVKDAKEMKGFHNKDLSDLQLIFPDIAELIRLIDAGTVSYQAAREVFEEMLKTNGKPAEIIETKGFFQISDEKVLIEAIDGVISANPENAYKYRDGKISLFGFFVGQTIKATGGRANPKLLNELVKQRLMGYNNQNI